MGAQLLDCRGEPAIAAGAATLDRFEHVLQQYLGFVGDPLASVDKVLAADPSLVLGHCLKACFLLYRHQRPDDPETQVALRAVRELPMGNREQGHSAAVRSWAAGDREAAASAWEQTLLDHPRDLMALKLSQDMRYFLGQADQIRDGVARLLPHWQSSDSIPGSGFVLGMYAFGLEECGDYRRAEDYGLQALALNRKDAWANHALTHVFEMEGRPEAGIAWLNEHRADWAPDNFFAIHHWWHLALFHFEMGHVDRVVSLYDDALRAEHSQLGLHLVDASSLLWRLSLAAIDIGKRAAELADAWQPLLDRSVLPFNDLHAMMALVLARREAACGSLIADLSQSASPLSRELALPVCRAFWAHAQDRFDRVVELLLPIRYALRALGGSHAQRDVVDLTLLSAAARAGHHRLAQSLMAERRARGRTRRLDSLA